jgi:hypothetical protein
MVAVQDQITMEPVAELAATEPVAGAEVARGNIILAATQFGVVERKVTMQQAALMKVLEGVGADILAPLIRAHTM